MSFLLGSTFHGIGAKEYTDIDISSPEAFMASLLRNFSTAFGWVGLSFFIVSDCFITMSFAQVLQVPILKPVYYREKKAGMFSASAYFLSSFMTSSITLFFYPLCTSMITYYIF